MFTFAQEQKKKQKQRTKISTKIKSRISSSKIIMKLNKKKDI